MIAEGNGNSARSVATRDRTTIIFSCAIQRNATSSRRRSLYEPKAPSENTFQDWSWSSVCLTWCCIMCKHYAHAKDALSSDYIQQTLPVTYTRVSTRILHIRDTFTPRRSLALPFRVPDRHDRQYYRIAKLVARTSYRIHTPYHFNSRRTR